MDGGVASVSDRNRSRLARHAWLHFFAISETLLSYKLDESVQYVSRKTFVVLFIGLCDTNKKISMRSFPVKKMSH